MKPNYQETERLLFIAQITFANFLNLALTSGVPDSLKQKLSDGVSDVQVILVKELERMFNEEKRAAEQNKSTI